MNILIISLIAIFLIVTIITLLIVKSYNRLIHLKALATEGWSGIDIQLKRRYDLIPNLVSVVKNYATHEKNIFEKIADMRAQSMRTNNIQDKAIIENDITQTLKTIFALSENYPTLKANENFLSLQKDLGLVEQELQLARRYYNGATRNYNISTAQFPSAIIAKMYQFNPMPYFEITTPNERENPTISE